MRHMKMKELKAPDYFVQAEVDRLRVNIGFSGAEKKLIMFTSSEPNEGKSYISYHIWKGLAKSGKRVCMVDADMRKSTMRTSLQLSVTEGEFLGLTHYLSGQAKLEDVVYATDDPNAYILPTLTLINPSLLLEESRLDTMLDVLRETFDYVILDTPPLGMVSDGLKIASKSDGVVLIVRAHATRREAARGSVAQLDQVGCTLLGVVLNRVDNEKSKGYYSNGYYSKNYYNKGYYYYYYSNAERGERSKSSSHGDHRRLSSNSPSEESSTSQSE